MSLSVFKRLLVLSILLGAIAVAGYGWYLHQMFNQQFGQLDDIPETFDVKPGDGMYRICSRMKQHGLIQDSRSFCRVAMWLGFNTVIKGRYALTPEDTPRSLLDKMRTGDVLQFSISLIEGHSFKQMLGRIQSNPNVVPILEGVSASDLMQRVANDSDLHPEGQFYPDTYTFSFGVTDLDILKRSHQTLKDVLSEEWEQKAKDLPYKDAYEALIMASIVEKETAVGSERPQISKVFVERLKLGMKLQTDPTVIYGMGDRYKGNITRKDLRRYTEYNTYKIKGLPPTPIAMVGREAIHAALHPEGKDALFFVAKGDGTHQFSMTLKEHNAAVRKYQLRRTKNYRSTPDQQ